MFHLLLVEASAGRTAGFSSVPLLPVPEGFTPNAREPRRGAGGWANLWEDPLRCAQPLHGKTTPPRLGDTLLFHLLLPILLVLARDRAIRGKARP